MSNLVGLFVVLPIITALLLLLFPKPTTHRRGFTAFALICLFGLSLWMVGYVWQHGSLVLRVGGWAAPYGIVLVADTLASIMVCLAMFTALICVLYGYAETLLHAEHPMRLPLMLFLLSGINLSFVTGDLFNLFVAFEVLLLSSYALLTLETGAKESRRALPYLTINLVGSALFLAACGFAYSLLGTLNFAEMIVRLPEAAGDFRITLLAVLMALVFGIKAGVFPLYYWLPGSYPIMPAPVMAFYGGLLTKVGIYVFLRIFGTVLPPDLTGLHTAFAWIGVVTMFVGVLGAVAQTRIQRILSFHIVSQIGYLMLAIGLFSPAAWTAGIFFLGHNILVKSSLFLAGGVVTRINGTDELSRTAGLWRVAPGLSVGFLLQALSLAGLPPFSGFWGKLLLVQSGFSQGEWVLAGLALLGGILTLMSMLKIWLNAFWREGPVALRPPDRGTERMVSAVMGMTAAAVIVGLGAGFFIRLANHAATTTLDRAGYVTAVQAANQTYYEGKQ